MKISTRFVKSDRSTGPFCNMERYTDIDTGVDITICKLYQVPKILVEQILSEHGGGDSHEDLPSIRTLKKYRYDGEINEEGFQKVLIKFERDLRKIGSYEDMGKITLDEGWGYETPRSRRC